MTKLAKLQLYLFDLLETGRGNNKASKVVDVLIMSLVILAVLTVIAESVASLRALYGEIFIYFEVFFLTFFCVEYFLRLWCSPLRYPELPPSKARFQYVFSFYGIVDLLAILPLFLVAIFPNLDLVILRILRLLRFVKISQYNNALHDLFSAIYHERKSFLSTAYIFALTLILSASLIYFAEGQAQPDRFSSIPESLWWAIISLTTVGYGDVYPITPLGKLIGAITSVVGVCTVALLTGIVANAFSEQLARKRAVFQNAIIRALEDGIITSEETDMLAQMRDEFNLTHQYAEAIFEKALNDYVKKDESQM